MLDRLLSAALAAGLFLLSCSTAFAYYSGDSYEGDVTFTGMVEIPDSTPDVLIVPSYINLQLLYLAGPLQAAARKSAPKSDEKIDILDKHRDSKTGKLHVRYRYAGTFVLDSALQDVVKVRLPLDAESIWERSTDACYSFGSSHRIAYFWNPASKGCKLVEGDDYFTTDATIVRKLANTTSTTPAYERLANSDGEIRIVLAFGADIDAKGRLAPDKNDDYNAVNYRNTRKFLLKQGFSTRPVPVDQRERECGTTKPLAAAPGLVEELTRQDAGRKIVVRLFWGVANAGDESNAFFCMMKEAAERGSVLIYAGHSRIGALDLKYMSDQIGAPIRMNPSQYQIYGFFGCSSYGYYNLSYFASRASTADPDGTRNTDIVTNGITGSFYAMADFNIKTVTPILDWSARGTRTTWQQIMGSYAKTFLTGVNGDE